MSSFSARHAHPFTLAEAIQLEVPHIAEEIARLQNSIKHLESSQITLRDYLSSVDERDKDVKEALAENEQVIAAQEERIEMLKAALERKGAPMSAHYELEEKEIVPAAGRTVAEEEGEDSLQADDDGAGIHL